MHKHDTANGSLLIFKTIKELPILRYNLLNKFIAQDNGIGADLEAVNRHFSRLDTFLQAGDIESAMLERRNLHLNFHLMFNDVDLKSRAFLCFVHSIDEHEVGDLNDDNEVDTCIILLGKIGLTVGEMEAQLADIRKKWTVS